MRTKEKKTTANVIRTQLKKKILKTKNYRSRLNQAKEAGLTLSQWMRQKYREVEDAIKNPPELDWVSKRWGWR